MPAKPKSPGAELLCALVTKVYDWCVFNSSFTRVITDLPVAPPGTRAVCHFIAAPTCTAVRREPADGGLAHVTLRNEATVQVTFMDMFGHALAGGIRTITWEEFLTLCVPAGTQIDCTVLASSCKVAVLPLPQSPVEVEIDICQAVQSTAEAVVHLQTAADGCS